MLLTELSSLQVPEVLVRSGRDVLPSIKMMGLGYAVGVACVSQDRIWASWDVVWVYFPPPAHQHRPLHPHLMYQVGNIDIAGSIGEVGRSSII